MPRKQSAEYRSAARVLTRRRDIKASAAMPVSETCEDIADTAAVLRRVVEVAEDNAAFECANSVARVRALGAAVADMGESAECLGFAVNDALVRITPFFEIYDSVPRTKAWFVATAKKANNVFEKFEPVRLALAEQARRYEVARAADEEELRASKETSDYMTDTEYTLSTLEHLERKWLAVKGAPTSFSPSPAMLRLVRGTAAASACTTTEILVRTGGYRNFEPCGPCVYGFSGVTPSEFTLCRGCAKRKGADFWQHVRAMRRSFFASGEGAEFADKFAPDVPGAPPVTEDIPLPSGAPPGQLLEAPPTEMCGVPEPTEESGDSPPVVVAESTVVKGWFWW
jgi:hypothetical protein